MGVLFSHQRPDGEDFGELSRSRGVNMLMGPYRAERIRELLAARDNFVDEDLCAMHFEACPRQTEFFMKMV